MSFIVYILKTSGDTFYVGQTSNLDKRLIDHKSKKGAKYLRMFSSFKLVYTETYSTRSDALKREFEIKKLTKKQKISLINNLC